MPKPDETSEPKGTPTPPVDNGGGKGTRRKARTPPSPATPSANLGNPKPKKRRPFSVGMFRFGG